MPKFTPAEATPGICLRERSMLRAQSAQSIPLKRSFSVCRFSVFLTVLAILYVLRIEGRALSHPPGEGLAVANVPQADGEQGIDVIVVERMVNDFAVAPAPGEPQAAQHAQVLGHGGLADAGDGGQV